VSGAVGRLAPSILATVLLGAWLLLITSRQLALFPRSAAFPAELLPPPIVVGLILVAAAVRAVRPSLVSHVAFLVAFSFGLALLGSQLGQPLANSTADYCGDQCRTAILGRFVTFFGWPILAALALAILARREARSPAAAARERAAWSWAWAAAALVGGIAAAVVWGRIILPNG
jgi:hypothetical protein